MAKTKYFRIAVEGATATDGRKIEKQMLLDAVANFNRDTYGVRVNMEHIRGLSADGPFKAYGDVIALKSEDVEITLAGKKEWRLALFAELDPTDELIAINQARQKVYTSIEIAPNFAGSNKFGLVGLAVTDNPASLGTEMLQFSAAKPMLDARKLAPENLFSAAEETRFELVEGAAAGDDPATGAFAAMKAFFDRFSAVVPPVVPVPPVPPITPANDNAAPEAAGFAVLSEGLGLMAASITALGTKIDKDTGALRTELTALQTQLATTETPGFSRAPAHGGGGSAIVTDC